MAPLKGGSNVSPIRYIPPTITHHAELAGRYEPVPKSSRNACRTAIHKAVIRQPYAFLGIFSELLKHIGLSAECARLCEQYGAMRTTYPSPGFCCHGSAATDATAASRSNRRGDHQYFLSSCSRPSE